MVSDGSLFKKKIRTISTEFNTADARPITLLSNESKAYQDHTFKEIKHVTSHEKYSAAATKKS